MSRRGRDRRSGGPIPRLVRIRGRGTNNFSGNRDREGGRINRDNRDRSSYSGERESQEKEADWDTDTTELREKRGDNERSAGRERGRGRGRGMGEVTSDFVSLLLICHSTASVGINNFQNSTLISIMW